MFELDHFFPKSDYPYLSHSIFNLIPVCGVCNRRKSNGDVSLSNHYHPYDEKKNLNQDISFRYEDISLIKMHLYDITNLKVLLNENIGACQVSIKNHKVKFAFDKIIETNSDETDELAQKYYMYYNINLRNDENLETQLSQAEDLNQKLKIKLNEWLTGNKQLEIALEEQKKMSDELKENINSMFADNLKMQSLNIEIKSELNDENMSELSKSYKHQMFCSKKECFCLF